MKYATVALMLSLVSGPLIAQDNALPYETGNVKKFLEANKVQGLPSVVLYNFNLDSG